MSKAWCKAGCLPVLLFRRYWMTNSLHCCNSVPTVQGTNHLFTTFMTHNERLLSLGKKDDLHPGLCVAICLLIISAAMICQIQVACRASQVMLGWRLTSQKDQNQCKAWLKLYACGFAFQSTMKDYILQQKWPCCYCTRSDAEVNSQYPVYRGVPGNQIAAFQVVPIACPKASKWNAGIAVNLPQQKRKSPSLDRSAHVVQDLEVMILDWP